MCFRLARAERGALLKVGRHGQKATRSHGQTGECDRQPMASETCDSEYMVGVGCIPTQMACFTLGSLSSSCLEIEGRFFELVVLCCHEFAQWEASCRIVCPNQRSDVQIATQRCS